MNKHSLVLRLQGLFEISSLILFFLGYYTEIFWILYLGAGMLILDNITTIMFGLINPLYPIGLSVLFVLFFQPWYYGVFWACAVFTLLGIPNSFLKIWDPGTVLERARQNESLTSQSST